MKAFLFGKYQEDSTKQPDLPKYKNSEIKIDSEAKFNKLTIYNPGDTNRIYTINNIRIKLEYENTMCIKLGTIDRSSININENEKSYNKLKLVYSLNDNLLDKNTEIITVKSSKEEYVNLLLNQYIILLPKGQITISMEDEIKKIFLNIDYLDEII